MFCAGKIQFIEFIVLVQKKEGKDTKLEASDVSMNIKKTFAIICKLVQLQQNTFFFFLKTQSLKLLL